MRAMDRSIIQSDAEETSLPLRARRSSASPRVLIVRPSALGDVSRTVPVLVTLRRALPGAKIDWLVNDAYAPVIAHHPDLDAVVPFPRKEFSRIFRSLRVAREAGAWVKNLHAKSYDWVFDLQGLLRSGLLTRLTGATHRVGFANARELAWLGYNHRHRIDTRLHTVDRMLALVKAEGYALEHDTRLYLSPEDKAWLRNWCDENLDGDCDYACLAPTAKWLSKCWPIEHFATIAQKLLDTGSAGKRLVVLTGPGEREYVRPLLESLPNHRQAILCPTTTVGQMMAIISRARLVVTNDSAPLHIAVGFDRAIVAIFGPTDPGLVGPYGREDSVVRPPNTCYDARHHYRTLGDDQTLISQVSVQQVWEKIVEQVDHLGDI